MKLYSVCCRTEEISKYIATVGTSFGRMEMEVWNRGREEGTCGVRIKLIAVA